MKRLIVITLLSLVLSGPAGAAPLDTLSSNGWYQAVTRNQCPTQGCDVHAAIDTAGFMYIFGGCVYGNNAGGTHSNEVLRFKVAGDSIGWVDKLYRCNDSRNPWHGSCQAGQCYDSKRNCVWLSNVFGGLGSCQSGASATSQLYRFQCPNGPVTRASQRSMRSNYITYDPVHDKLIGVSSTGSGIVIYDCAADVMQSVAYPFTNAGRVYEVPCCVDTKRGLFVITQWSRLLTKVDVAGDTVLDTARLMKDVWFLNTETREWTKKTPPTYPWMWNAELAYDPVHDKYVYFGRTYSCRWGAKVSEVYVYDYDSNTWTRMPENGRSYNSSNPAQSTWPAIRTKHSWEYSVKSNAFVTWGHTTYGDCDDPLYSDDNLKTPLWLYRLDTAQASGVNKKVLAGPVSPSLTVSPNPFNTTVKIAGSRQRLADSDIGIIIYDINGKIVYELSATSYQLSAGITWSAAGLSPGLYLVRARVGSRTLEKKITLLK